jgi:hypothetical protein
MGTKINIHKHVNPPPVVVSWTLGGVVGYSGGKYMSKIKQPL